MNMRRSICWTLLTVAVGCGEQPRLTDAAPLRVHREIEEQKKPGTNVGLKGATIPQPNGFRIVNLDEFSWTLLDDIWLFVVAPNVEMRQGGPYIADRRPPYVYLRCPIQRNIPPQGEVEVLFDSCAITTYEPGVHARMTSFRVVAREGYFSQSLEPGVAVTRVGKPQ